MVADIRIRVPLTREEKLILEAEAEKANTTMGNVAHDLIKKALKQREIDERLDELLTVSYAILGLESWIGKHALGAIYEDEWAAYAANMFMQMVPGEVCDMALHMGKHMVKTGGDLRRAMATICAVPGVDVTLMNYTDDDEWRGIYDENGDLIEDWDTRNEDEDDEDDEDCA